MAERCTRRGVGQRTRPRNSTWDRAPGEDQPGQPGRGVRRLAEAPEHDEGDDRLGAHDPAAVAEPDHEPADQGPHAQQPEVKPGQRPGQTAHEGRERHEHRVGGRARPAVAVRRAPARRSRRASRRRPWSRRPPRTTRSCPALAPRRPGSPPAPPPAPTRRGGRTGRLPAPPRRPAIRACGTETLRAGQPAAR